MVNYYDQLLKQ